MTPAALESHVSRSHRRLRRLTVAQYAGSIAGLVASLVVAVTFDAPLMRVGAALLVLLFASVLTLLYRTPRTRDVGASLVDPSMESYRADLERHRKLFSGFRLWGRLAFGIPVAGVFCLGFARAYPALAQIISLEFAGIVVGLSVSCAIAHRKARRYQQEIDELDAMRR